MANVVERGLEYKVVQQGYFEPYPMPADMFYKELRKSTGLLGLKSTTLPFTFLEVLADCMRNPELELYTDVMFDAYTNDPEVVPANLYLCGYGQYLDQTPSGNYKRAMLGLCKHLNVMDRPFFNTDDGVFPPYLDHQILNTDQNDFIIPWSQRPAKVWEDAGKVIGSDVFLTNLTCAYALNIQSRFHEAWAYALTALDQKNVCPLLCLRSSVYLQLAISSANLALAPKITWLSLAEALRVQEYSIQKWEWICACSQVLVAVGMFEKEAQVYQKGMEIIPPRSSWYQVLVRHHLRGLQHQIENCLMTTSIIENCFESEETADAHYVLARQTIHQLCLEIEKLECLAVKELYKGYCLLYRFMMSLNEDMKRKYLDLTRVKLTDALKLMREDEPLKLEARQLVQFLNNEVVGGPGMACEWNERIRFYENLPKSEVFVRMALVYFYAKGTFRNFHTHGEWFVDAAQYSYCKYTQDRGYRCHLLKNLEKFKRPSWIPADQQETILSQIKYASDYWIEHSNIKLGPCEPTSENLVHENMYAEQAFCSGMAVICDPDDDPEELTEDFQARNEVGFRDMEEEDFENRNENRRVLNFQFIDEDTMVFTDV